MEKQLTAPPETPLLPPPGIESPNGYHKSPKRKRGWIWLAVLIVLGAAAYFLWPKVQGFLAQPAQSATGTGRRGRGRSANAAMPVVAVRATKGDIGVYYTGLGSVTPIYTVTIKSRVDGQLMSVHYKEGDMIQKGDLLAEIDPRPYQAALEQAQGNLIRDQALLANARIDLDRYQTLLTQNAVPEQTVATQKALVSQDEGIVKSDQGAIDTAKVNVTYSSITAPITGLVGLRLVDPGNIVHASDSNGLLVITQMHPISVIFTISEDQLPPVLKKYRAGQRLVVDAYDRTMNNKLADGTLANIDNQIDPSTGTLKLRANFDNQDNALFPNQFVNAKLLVQEKRGVTLLQTAAIQRNSQNTYVYLVKPDSTVTVRPITLGTTEGDESEVTSGLAPGDEVVMTGVDKLQEGSKVNAQVNGDKAAVQTGQNSGKSGKASKGKRGKAQ